MRMYIKNMVCVRCSQVVKSELEKLGIRHFNLSPGEVEFNESIPEELHTELKGAMDRLGLELTDDRESIIIDKIKTEIIHLISGSDAELKGKLSEYLSSKLGYSYHYLSTLFTTVHGSSIERYYISKRIDRVKEILFHDNLPLSEIAYKLHYSNVAHLSAQFKRETGITLTRFRELTHPILL